MQISTKDWKNYIAKLSKLNATAAEKMQQYIAKNGFADTEAIIDYAYGLVTKYGEGSAALSAQMFETVAEMEGAVIQPAVMAQTASRNEVAKMVNGIMKQSQNENVIANAVGRKVKQAGADTTLQNALRYGAEFAWIPAGDTCAFCIALASRGWQLASKKAIKNGHAEHIHSNCDCTYAIRFDSKTHIEGYDPKYYERMYYDAQDRAAEEGTFWSGKSDKDAINQMRRDKYKLNAEKIREQHRVSYAKKQINADFNDTTREYYNNATPGKGKYIVDDDVDTSRSKDEIKMAEDIHRVFGGDITVLAESTTEGIKNPDYLWNGKLWDLKTTSNEKACSNAIRKGLKQIERNPGGIILDYGNLNIDNKKLEEIMDKRMLWNKEKDVDILVRNKGEYRVYRYRHKE